MAKSSEKQLREKVKLIERFADGGYIADGIPLVDTLYNLVGVCRRALAASETTDLDRLVGWLCHDWIMHLPTGHKVYDDTRLALMDDILVHIAEEFGVGGDDE